MKRFWTETKIAPGPDGFVILLDEKNLRLPSGKTLTVPFHALALAIAAEWQQAGGETKNFAQDDLPLTRLTTTAQDRVSLHRTAIIRQLAAYGMNDLLCYRALNQPGLSAREDAAWTPWLDWAADLFDARLLTTEGVIPIEQPQQAYIAFEAALSRMTAYQLAGLGVIVPALGSLVLGLAVAEGTLSSGEACDLAHLDELWQEDVWGVDSEAMARREAILQDIAVSTRFMVLCQP